MALVAERLNTQWLLSGFVNPDGNGVVVEVQLVSAAEAHGSARTERFRIRRMQDLDASVHEAWLRLVAKP